MTTIPPTCIPVEIKVVDARLAAFGGLPAAATPGAAGVDVVALGFYQIGPNGKPDMSYRLPLDYAMKLAPGEVAFLGLGFAMDIMDPNYAAFLLPRSGLGSALGVILANGTGLIDSDFHGEVVCALWNRIPPVAYIDGRVSPQTQRAVTINPGDRIAQMYFGPVVRPGWITVQQFSRDTQRGSGGFGSTGAPPSPLG